MKDSVTIPDFEWYATIGTHRGVSPRCPFASADRCPRYFLSLSALGDAGFTKIAKAEEDRLLRRWKSSDLWPKTDEQSTSILSSGRDGEERAFLFSNFCPEVSYEGFGLFASSLSRHADEIDVDFVHRRLQEIKAPITDWRWSWAHVRPMHYTECSLYSVLKQERTRMPLSPAQRLYVENKLESLAAQAVQDSLVAVNDARARATRAGALGDERSYLVYNDAVTAVIKTTLPRMARIAFHVAGDHSDEVANVLDTTATKVITEITQSLERKFHHAARAFGDRPKVHELADTLTRMKDQAVEDFRHGLDGDAPLANQKSGDTYNVMQTNSPGAQLAVGVGNQQTLQSATLSNALDEVVAAALRRTSGSEADEIARLADLVRAELRKPIADAPKVRTWIDRLGEIVKGAGLVAEAGKLATAFIGWLSSIGE